MQRREFLQTGATLAGALAVGQSAFGQAAAYPEKTVRYFIPFPPGGESDIAARIQQAAFKRLFNHDMIVENKAGAGGALAWSQLNGMAGDGYSIMGINVPHIVLQPLEGNVQYKTEDITPVYWFHYTPDALLVPVDSPYKTFQDFVKAAKDKNAPLTLAGSATFSANHLATERLNQLAGTAVTYVPFKGTGDLVASLLGKHVTGAMSYTPLAIAQKGKVRVLAVAMPERHPQFPDSPTFKELGFDWVDGAYRGIGLPKSTPPDVRKRVSDVIDAINKDPETRKKMIDAGFEVVDIGVDRAAQFVKDRTPGYLEIAKRMGMVK